MGHIQYTDPQSSQSNLRFYRVLLLGLLGGHDPMHAQIKLKADYIFNTHLLSRYHDAMEGQ